MVVKITVHTRSPIHPIKAIYNFTKIRINGFYLLRTHIYIYILGKWFDCFRCLSFISFHLFVYIVVDVDDDFTAFRIPLCMHYMLGCVLVCASFVRIFTFLIKRVRESDYKRFYCYFFFILFFIPFVWFIF